MNENTPKPGPDLFPHSPSINIPPFPSASESEEPTVSSGVDAVTNEAEAVIERKVGDRKVDPDNRLLYEWIGTPSTLRNHYSHHIEGVGPGIAWDSRFDLLDEDYAIKTHGRTFTHDEIFDPDKNMPNDPITVFGWKCIGKATEEAPDGN
jgi:hypothetical protein